MEIQPFREFHCSALKDFTDEEIGDGYYTAEEIQGFVEKSVFKSKTASFVLVDGAAIKGVRLSFPQGQWQRGKGSGLSPSKWPHDFSETAYFQSLFVAKDLQRQGWGTKLSQQSLSVLKQMGARGVVCHSWVESPGDSSGHYLRALGFRSVNKHKNYWLSVDYQCPRCGRPCCCTAEEMYFDFQEQKI